MRAARIHEFGGPQQIVVDEIARPEPKQGQVVVKVAAAGVGPWDALIREKTSAVDVTLPLILGSDFAGTVASVGTAVTDFKLGDQVYGVTNKDFYGAYAEYAIADAGMSALKPKALDLIDAASVPVVAVTAWQMLFDYAELKAGDSVLIQGAAGNVGAYAVQLARHFGLQIYATAGSADLEYVHGLGAEVVLDYKTVKFEEAVPPVDAVMDMVGGDVQRRSLNAIKPGGILVSVVSPLTENLQKGSGVRSVFFLVDVTTSRLNVLSKLFESGDLVTDVGTVLPLEQVRAAHEMLAGSPHKRGKILLKM